MRYALKHCETEFNGELCRFTGPCIHTGERYSVTVPQRAVIEWMKGELIQNVLPDTHVDDREFLMTGYSPAGWKEAFSE